MSSRRLKKIQFLAKQITNKRHLVTGGLQLTILLIIKACFLCLCLKNLSLSLFISNFGLLIINKCFLILLGIIRLLLSSHRFCDLAKSTCKVEILTIHRKRFRMDRLRTKHEKRIISCVFEALTLIGRQLCSLPFCHIFRCLNLLIKAIIAGSKIQTRLENASTSSYQRSTNQGVHKRKKTGWLSGGLRPQIQRLVQGGGLRSPPLPPDLLPSGGGNIREKLGSSRDGYHLS